jgi:hypothetical protein
MTIFEVVATQRSALRKTILEGWQRFEALQAGRSLRERVAEAES